MADIVDLNKYRASREEAEKAQEAAARERLEQRERANEALQGIEEMAPGSNPVVSAEPQLRREPAVVREIPQAAKPIKPETVPTLDTERMKVELSQMLESGQDLGNIVDTLRQISQGGESESAQDQLNQKRKLAA